MVVSFLRADLGQVLVLKLADILSPMLDEAVAPCALERPVSTEASDGLVGLGAGRARLFEGPPRAVLSALDGDVGVDDVGVPVARVVLLLGAVDDGVPGEALEVFLAPTLDRLLPLGARQLVGEFEDDLPLHVRDPGLPVANSGGFGFELFGRRLVPASQFFFAEAAPGDVRARLLDVLPQRLLLFAGDSEGKMLVVEALQRCVHELRESPLTAFSRRGRHVRMALLPPLDR